MAPSNPCVTIMFSCHLQIKVSIVFLISLGRWNLSTVLWEAGCDELSMIICSPVTSRHAHGGFQESLSNSTTFRSCMLPSFTISLHSSRSAMVNLTEVQQISFFFNKVETFKRFKQKWRIQPERSSFNFRRFELVDLIELRRRLEYKHIPQEDRTDRITAWTRLRNKINEKEGKSQWFVIVTCYCQ